MKKRQSTSDKQPPASDAPAAAPDQRPAAAAKQPQKPAARPTKKRPATAAKRPATRPNVGWDDWNLQERRVEAIRKLAVGIAEANEGPGMVLICNPSTEPSPLPKAELLDDHCAWCNVSIYYDRKMPSPADITRVCIPCGVLLLEAEKKGRN